MRATTVAWVKLESKGKPADTTIGRDTIGGIAKLILTWLLQVEMGHKIVITIGRTESDVNPRSETSELMAEFDAILSRQTDSEPAQTAPESDECRHRKTEMVGAFNVCVDCRSVVDLT